MQGDTGSPSDARQHVDAAVLLHGQGKHAEAEAECRAALRLEANHIGALDLLCLILAETGRLPAAADSYRRLAALTPGDPAVHANLGKVLHSMGQYRQAMGSLQRSLALRPDSAETHIYLCNVLAALNRPQDALASCNKAIELDPNMPVAHNHAGNLLAAMGRHHEAIAAFEKALALDPGAAATLNGLGNSLSALGRHEKALVCFERALAADPKFVMAHYNMGMALAALNRHEEAVTHFRAVDATWPRHPGTLYNLGNSLFASFRAAEALEAFERLLAADPRAMQAHLGTGNALQALGRIADARAAYERALALAPDVPTLHRAVADIKKFREDDPQLKTMEALARNMTRFSEQECVSLHFALAKAYDDLGRHDAAFKHWRDGNALKRRMTVYDETAKLGAMRDIESAFTAELIRARRGQGDPSVLPVFIVGMPRSGTTLIEQMLASHPRAFGAGELRYLSDLVQEGKAGARFPFGFASLSNEELCRLGNLYTDRLKSHAPRADRIADKLPANFQNIGLIHLALPNARIIHIKRDPLDTCFSCYSKLFVNNLEFTCDLGELGRYYRAYESLMAHWRRVLPEGAMLEVQYEDLVADFEAQSKRIVEYCGLEWDERCLKFHESERPIYTVSVQQVRHPLFNSSVGRWRPYKEHLRVLFDTLGIDPV